MAVRIGPPPGAVSWGRLGANGAVLSSDGSNAPSLPLEEAATQMPDVTQLA